MNTIVASGTRLFSVEFKKFGYVDVDRGAGVGRADGYATEADAVAAATAHIREKPAGATHNIAGVAVVRDGARFDLFETEAAAGATEVPYDLLYDDGHKIHVPVAFAAAPGVDVVDVITGSAAGSAKGDATQRQFVTSSAAMSVPREAALSHEATDPQRDIKATGGSGFPFGSIAKWGGIGIGGLAATTVGVKWILPWLLHAGPVSSGVSAAIVGAGLAVGGNALMGGAHPTVDPKLIRRSLGAGGLVVAAGGGAWLAKAVHDSEYLARTPAKRLVGVGIGVALGSIVAGELIA